jgi:hypothetical protein
MSSTKRVANKVRKVILDILEEIRSNHIALSEELDIPYKDPLADVRLTVQDDDKCVVLHYDGCGNEYFNYDNYMIHPMTGSRLSFADHYRPLLDQRLQEIRQNLYTECINTCSLAINLE